jgi:hypothetical protein
MSRQLNQVSQLLRSKYTCHSDHGAPAVTKLLDYACVIVDVKAVKDSSSPIRLTLSCAVASLEYLTIVDPLDVPYSTQGHSTIK